MRSKFPVAIHLLFLIDNQVLLLRRFNTGYEDGNYSVVAGHVDLGETVTQAAIREASEEVGVILQPQDIQVVHTMNRRSDDERIDFFAVVKSWKGEITNNEPEKCDELSWFSTDSLPSNIISYVKYAIENYQNELYYSEFGWRAASR